MLVTQTSPFAFETDQYNLPPKPLADIGDEVTAHEHQLRKAVYEINEEIRARQACLARDSRSKGESGCKSDQDERARLAYLRSEAAVAHEAFNQLGAGVPPFTSISTEKFSHRQLGADKRR